MKRIFALSCGFYLLIGITSVALGSVLSALLKYYDRNYADGGTLLFLQFVGFLAGVSISPLLSARIGRKAMLSIALVSIVAAYTVIGCLPSWVWIMLMAAGAGFGSGIIESSIGAFTIEFAEEKKAVAMTKLDVYFGVGALLIPAVASVCILFGVWKVTFFTIAILTLILLVFWMTMPRESSERLRRTSALESGETASKPRYNRQQVRLLSIFILFFFVYMGLELGLMNFLPSILIVTTAMDQSLASLSVTFLWVAIVIGRLFVGRIAESIRYIPFLLWSVAGTLFFTIAMVVAPYEWTAYLFIFGIGIFMSGLFCIALVYANTLIVGMTEKTTSLLIASGGIGGAVLQYLIGWTMENWPGLNPVWLLAGFCCFLLLAIGCSYRLRQEQPGLEHSM